MKPIKVPIAIKRRSPLKVPINKTQAKDLSDIKTKRKLKRNFKRAKRQVTRIPKII